MVPHHRKTTQATPAIQATQATRATQEKTARPLSPSLSARLGSRGVRTALAGALGSAMAAATAMPASAAPQPGSHHDGDVTAVKAHIAALYRQAEQLTQTYDAAQEQSAQLTIAVQRSQSALEERREDYAKQQTMLGRMASAQYRAGGLDQRLELMLSDHPDTYLSNAALVDRLDQDQLQKVTSATEDERQLIQLQRTASDDLAALGETRLQAAQARRDVTAQLRQAQALLNTLTARQRWAVAVAEEGFDGSGGEGAGGAGGGGGYGGGPGAGGPGGGPGGGQLPPPASLADTTAPSARARMAIEAAYADLGKPYVYGAEGPEAFDCSGLIQRVWGQAGVELPRTSSEQAAAGHQVPLSDIRPGDLVIYYQGRNHIGLYVGDGKIIHAPHPGSDVRVSPLMSMPVNMVVRV